MGRRLTLTAPITISYLSPLIIVFGTIRDPLLLSSPRTSMFRTPGALSGAWADPLPSVQLSPKPQPQPQPRAALSVSQTHAHAFSTPKGWEGPEHSRPAPDLAPPSPAAIYGSNTEKPKWVLPYRRFEDKDLPYTAWKAVPSASSSLIGAAETPLPSSSTGSSGHSSQRTPRAGGSDLGRATLKQARNFSPSSSYRTARTHQSTWKWANQLVIPDPDFPDGPPPCLSPRPASVKSPSRRSSGAKQIRLVRSAGDADRPRRADENDPSSDGDGDGDGAVGAYFDLPIDANHDPDRLAVSEVSVFGDVGTVDTVWGRKQPSLGLCKCKGLRFRYREHGETCPLHIKSMKSGPAARNSAESEA
ncbi:hypothetical protein FRB90_008730 [Tulasnella sp. 427]|nr:hypothetical protein FRB90_008730 [Tulasnella sp. 427]